MSCLTCDVINNDQFNGRQYGHYVDLYAELLIGWHGEIMEDSPKIHATSAKL